MRWWLSGRGVDEEKLVILQTWTGNPAAGCQDEVHCGDEKDECRGPGSVFRRES
jgi:hypothetical protein